MASILLRVSFLASSSQFPTSSPISIVQFPSLATYCNSGKFVILPFFFCADGDGARRVPDNCDLELAIKDKTGGVTYVVILFTLHFS